MGQAVCQIGGVGVRPIKFRAWDESDGVMFYSTNKDWTTLKADRPDNKYGVVMEGNLQGVLGLPLMQFTGLLDKNGKEIYEGDLIELSIGGDKQAGVLEVDYLNLHIGINESDSYLRMNPNSFFVVGNIYSNPELLSQERKE